MRNPIPAMLEMLSMISGRLVRAVEQAALPDLLPLGAMPEGVQPPPVKASLRDLTPHEMLVRVGRDITARAAPVERIQIGPLDV